MKQTQETAVATVTAVRQAAVEAASMAAAAEVEAARAKTRALLSTAAQKETDP